MCITPPQVLHDMRQDTTWTQTGTFQDKQALFKDLAIMLDGVAFVEANNPGSKARPTAAKVPRTRATG